MKPHVRGVSDHAVLRYLERVGGIDIEAARREIAARVDRVIGDPRVIAVPEATGVVIDGFAYRLQDGVVVTVLKVNHPDPRTGKVRAERKED
jgi:hypothetical protein